MTSDRILSLNDVATEFAVEELEPRMEMQMLGLGADPGIIISGDGFVIIISGTICTTYYCWYFV